MAGFFFSFNPHQKNEINNEKKFDPKNPLFYTDNTKEKTK